MVVNLEDFLGLNPVRRIIIFISGTMVVGTLIIIRKMIRLVLSLSKVRLPENSKNLARTVLGV